MLNALSAADSQFRTNGALFSIPLVEHLITFGMPSFQPWWPLVGVVLGFALGEGSRYLRYRFDVRKRKRLVERELKSIVDQLPQKRDILHQAIGKLKEQQILPLRSVRFITSGYSSVLSDIYQHLTPTQRSCLHVIYERVRVVDEVMDEFDTKILQAIREKIINHPWEAFRGYLEDLLHSLDVIEHLAASYLKGEPVDVFESGDR